MCISLVGCDGLGVNARVITGEELPQKFLRRLYRCSSGLQQDCPYSSFQEHPDSYRNRGSICVVDSAAYPNKLSANAKAVLCVPLHHRYMLLAVDGQQHGRVVRESCTSSCLLAAVSLV